MADTRPRHHRRWPEPSRVAEIVALTLVAFTLTVPGASAAGATTTAKSKTANARLDAAAGALVGTIDKTAAATQPEAASAASKPTQPPTTTGKTRPARSATSPSAASTPAPAKPVPLAGWMGDGAAFPHRAIILAAPSGGRPLTANTIRATENGDPVNGAILTPLSQARTGDLATVLVVDQSQTMAGAPLAAAMRAARDFARARKAQQELGLVTFDAVPSVFLHPTSDKSSISTVLSSGLLTGRGANVPAAVTVALRELTRANVALGAVIVVSDGNGQLTSPRGPKPGSVARAATAAHVPIFTVGLQDAASSEASMKALAAASPGEFVSATRDSLPGVLRAISGSLARGYVLRYRSHQPAGSEVNVNVSATGFSGLLSVKYKAPTAAAARPVIPAANVAGSKQRQAAPQQHRAAAGEFVGSTLLSPTPSFAPHRSPGHARSFWASSRSLPIVAGIAAVLFTLAIALLFYRPSRRSVRVRVQSFIPDNGEPEPEAVIELGTHRSRAPRFLERGTWWAPFVEDVAISRSPHTPVYLVKRAALLGAIVAVAVFLFTGSPLFALLPLLLWPFPLRMLVRRQARKQREVFADALPGYLQDLASALRVGRSFAGSLSVVASTADEPVRSELERAVTDEALGRPIDESLEAVGRRMESGDIDQVALIASLNRRSGSNVAEALDRVADGARDRSDLRREIKALTAQAKMSSWVLTALPPLLLLGITVVSPRYAWPLLHTTLGIILLIVGALMVFAGWKVMRKITTIKA